MFFDVNTACVVESFLLKLAHVLKMKPVFRNIGELQSSILNIDLRQTAL